MKLNFWNRVLVALMGLLVFLFGVCVFVYALFPLNVDWQSLNGPYVLWQRLAIAGGALLLVLLGFHGLWVLFHREDGKGFIMQHTEYGDMSISMNALETLVHKCVDQHQELTVKSTRMSRVKNGIVVEIRIILASGVNIPNTVNGLQRQIKEYITSCSGVEVREVRVLVETGAVKPRYAQKELVMDARTHAAAEPAEAVAEAPTETPAEPEPLPPEPVEEEPVHEVEIADEPQVISEEDEDGKPE